MDNEEILGVHDTLNSVARDIRNQFGADCVLVLVAMDNEGEKTSHLVYGASGHTLLRRAMADEYVQSTFDNTFVTRENLTGDEPDGDSDE